VLKEHTAVAPEMLQTGVELTVIVTGTHVGVVHPLVVVAMIQ
jgi:hypothetical protein